MAMTCEEIEQQEVAEDYVLGRLDDNRQQAFEDHYFDCTECLARVRAVQDLHAVLMAPAAGPPERNLRRPLAILATAAVLILGVRTGHQVWTDRAQQVRPAAPAADVTLSKTPTVTIQLPPYSPARLRAVPSDAQRTFREAMAQYTATNCTAAIPGLQRALALDETFTQARFYLGACQLHDGSVSEAATNLQRVVATGESPYLEDAHWFLAQARVKQGDLEGARQELQRVIALNGDRREAAVRLLRELRP